MHIITKSCHDQDYKADSRLMTVLWRNSSRVTKFAGLAEHHPPSRLLKHWRDVMVQPHLVSTSNVDLVPYKVDIIRCPSGGSELKVVRDTSVPGISVASDR
jgi:hypothetical protein